MVIDHYTDLDFVLKDFSVQFDVFKNECSTETFEYKDYLNYENGTSNTEVPCLGISKSQNVKLPKFTFHTLIISNYPDYESYGIFPFESINLLKAVIDIFKSSNKLKPKYASLYFTGVNNCGPTFLNQNASRINYKLINCVGCNQGSSCICGNKILKENLKYTS
ncbi:15989_t:CDS:2 [Funneliformis mosseae]|uniref:15989_t:CDS:1 n=1 Tax=Funneliformis mosseae TaxID=27381 RepID=A0A9N8Z3Q4_FUNMO|nr:15989_t:CDS:2 [Funneliformis mosseae]